MKYSTLFLVAVLLFFFPVTMLSQAIFSDDFNYSEGTRLVGQNGWNRTPWDPATGEMTVGSDGLTYPGYPGSGIGKAISITGGGASESPTRYVSMPMSGIIYISCLVNISGTDANEGYFFTLGNSNGGNYRAVVYTKIVSGSVYFGASATFDVPTYDPTPYVLNTTYLVVLKYSFIDGGDNDEVRLYVLSNDVPASEPGTANIGPLIMPNEGFDFATVILSSGHYNTNGAHLLGAELLVDGVRMGSSWAQTLLPAPVFSATPSNLNFGIIAAGTTKVDSFKIKNSGTVAMNISSVVSDNASFISSQGDTAIAVGDSVYYYVTFAPTTTGWKSGTLKFYHDAAGSPSSLLLGGNVFAEEPSLQASDMVFSSVKSNSMALSWTNGDGSNRIVIIKTGSVVDAFPVDEQSYSSDSRYGIGSEIGSGNFVVYAGSGSMCVVNGLSPTTDYYFAIMEYNGISGAENYLITSPLTGTQTTTIGTIWSSSNGNITFTKSNYANWTQAGNQDRITDNVWITRENSKGIFNIRSESSAGQGCSAIEPGGTEWAYGTTADIGSLTFDTWINTNGCTPPSMVDQDMVLHLIDEDIYLDIKFLSWTAGASYGVGPGGGGFSYVRGAGLFEVQTTMASDITGTTVTLSGSVFSLESAATAYALYGTSSGIYNDSVLVTTDPIDAGSQTSVSADVTGLTPGVMHYFCIAASNGTDYKRSGEMDFFTYSSSPENALKFDGSDDYVEVPYNSALNPSTFTYEFWARVDGGSGTYRCPLSTRYWDWGGSFYGVNFYAREDNVWDFAWGGGAGAGNWYGITGSTVEEGEWTHLAATNDGTTMSFYINGILQGDATLAYAPAPYDFIPLRFGSIADDVNYFFNGAMDEVRVWNVARTAEEIQNNMNSPFTEAQAGLVGYWQTNEINGTVAHDLAGSNNGTLYNFNFDVTSGWMVSDNSMPVELASFSAAPKENNVELKWKTATEENNYGFEVQRSEVRSHRSEGNWTKVGFVEGSGNSNAPKDYSFVEKRVGNGKYSYRLKLINNDGSFKYSYCVEIEVKFIPSVFALSQNFPNPFNPSTTIDYQLPKESKVTLKMYDVLGKEVATVVDEMKEAGSYNVQIDAGGFASGVYFYRIVAGDFVSIKKMVLMK